MRRLPADWSGPSDEAPGLFGWGTPRWITRMTQSPAPDKYGYLDDAKDACPPYAGQLTDNDAIVPSSGISKRLPSAPFSRPASMLSRTVP